MVITIRNSHVFFQNICHPQNRLYAKTRGVTGHKDIPADTLRRHTSRWSWTSHTNLVHAAPNHTQRPWCRELNNYHKQGFDVSGTFFAISGDDWHNSNLLQNTVLWRKVWTLIIYFLGRVLIFHRICVP